MYKIYVPTIVTNGHFNKEKTLAELKRVKADNVVLSLERRIGHSFSTPKELELLAELIKYFDENGVESSVWLGETFGHSGGPAGKDSPYTNIRTLDGEDIEAFCPMDESFTRDFCDWVVKVARCGARLILLDDDFRLGFRGNGVIGCFCKHHMAALERELGESITLEAAVEKCLYGKPGRYRDAWMRVQGRSMIAFSRALRKALDTVNPEARMGFCTNPNFDFLDCDMLDIAKALAGDTRPIIRLFGAPYWTANAPKEYPLGAFIEFSRTQASWFKNKDIELISEGDVFPRPRFSCSSARLECMDTILRADISNDGMLKYMLDYMSDADYETGYVDASVANRGVYADIDRLFSGKKAVGVRPYNVMKSFAGRNITSRRVLEAAEFSTRYPSLYFATGLNLPISYEPDGVNILFGENARFVSRDELKNGSVIDIAAARHLAERGIDVGIKSFDGALGGVISEYFTDEGIYTRLEAGVYCENAKIADSAIIRSELVVDGKHFPLSYTYENAQGERFLVNLFDAQDAMIKFGWFLSYARSRMVSNVLPWLGKNHKDVHVIGNYPYIYLLAKEDERELSIGVWNLFEDPAKSVRLSVPYEIKDIEFIGCMGRYDGNIITLENDIRAFGQALVRIVK
ncbi:MAG: hypothetical protein IJD67_03185 [Clostridia bacterium]|nr:hypothetical protein [Clostridia bacterium]